MKAWPPTSSVSLQWLFGSLYLFIFSLPFEYWDPLGIANVLSVSKMAGLIFAVTFVLNYSRFRVTGNYAAELFLLWFLSFVRCQSFVDGLDLTFLQCVVMFVMLAHVFTVFPVAREKSVFCLVAGVIVMVLLLCTGIGEEYVGNKDINGRLTFFGTSSNMIGFWGALGCAVIFSFLFAPSVSKKMKGVGLACLPCIFYAINASGSRGGFILVFLALAVTVVFLPGKALRKILVLAVGSGLGMVYFSTLSPDSVLYQRLMMFVESQDLEERGVIWQMALELWKQTPFWGAGVDTYNYEITLVLGEIRDTHNIFIWYLVTGGLVSLTIFLIFLWRQCRRLWRANPRDVLAIIFMFMCLFMFMKSGGIKNQKVIWVLMAYIASCSYKNQLPTANFVKKTGVSQ